MKIGLCKESVSNTGQELHQYLQNHQLPPIIEHKKNRDYFLRDNSHDQSSKLFKQNQQLDFYVQNSNFICI
jgi:hypothetical protein